MVEPRFYCAAFLAGRKRKPEKEILSKTG